MFRENCVAILSLDNHNTGVIYAVVDIETTGGHASAHGITEVAILVFDGESVIDRFETLVNPQQPIPYFIQSMTGITNAMVATAPVFEAIAGKVYDLLNDKIFVAHNVNFDYSFIKHQLLVCGYQLETPKLCTVRLSRKVWAHLSSFSLGNLCRSLDIPVHHRHRAGGDAAATVCLLTRLLQHGALPHIEQALKKSSREKYLPMHVPREQIDQLPARPGVYYFRDQKGKVVYVGKAKNLRSRVSSHFSHNGTSRQKQEFTRNVYDISCQVCGTELMAAVLEETEIKKLWPVYNVAGKRPVTQYGLYVFEDRRGYARLAIERKKKHLRPVYTFGLLWDGYRMLWNMIEKHQLSPRLCFVDKSRDIAEEAALCDDPDVYNKRVEEALNRLEEALPSFVLLGEGLADGERSCMLMEKGKFYGMGYIPAQMKIDLRRLKNILTPYPDNDNIRQMLYKHAETYPYRKVDL